MSAAEDYLVLGLRLGKHVDGLVDFYYGPAELKEQVDAEELAPAEQLVADAATLRDSLEDGWLRDQVNGLWTYARVLGGEQLSYSDEVEGCFGVRPERTPDAVFERAHAELDELLPGDGTLQERRLAWRERHLASGEASVPIMRDLMPLLRDRTARVVDLPEGERVTLEPVSDEPWWAFNYYQGDLHSRVVLNTDTPTTGLDLLHLVAHEIYPGHHTEHAVKERLLGIEESIAMVPTPSSVINEGIAEAGFDVVLDDEGKEEAYALLQGHGLEVPEPELAERIGHAFEALGTISLNAALMIFEDGVGEQEAQDYVQRWSLNDAERAAHSIRFVTDPTWRSYTITYSAGRELCRRYIAGDPAKLRTLLTEHVRIGQLLSA